MFKWPLIGAKLESIVDEMMAEAVQLQPYKDAGGGFSARVPDDSRPVVDAVGYIIGRGTFLRGGDSALMQRRAAADWLLAIQDKYLVGIGQFDHVILKDRDLRTSYEISYIEDSANKRPKLHLLRNKASS